MRRANDMNIQAAAFTDNRDTSDNYARVIFRESELRVAVCRSGIQWLLQRRRAHVAPGGAAWDTLSYHRERRALIRLYRKFSGADATELQRLPENFRAFKCTGVAQ